MKHKKYSNKQGISLLEVIIFISILSLIFLATVFVTTSSLQKAQYNQNKIKASRFSEELVEWMRGEKEATWSAFVARSADTPGNTYCFNSTSISWPGIGSCSASYGLEDRFLRQATLVGTGSQVKISVIVQWKEVRNTYTIPVDTVFSLWE
ncbi:hypothetical protein A3D06_01865 [Candidatus Roizmanbacteria bacterium RIFCSPHIGHO2_02_FULL_40_9]|uniref:Type II secretion system protein GspI C-terminal domain-containing protein n=2 Tax=Candidatus Roizmaniibacteriota TaxID=1752723 RepID=A0A1F7INY2_9BACT|nr:MAG: hypothetical protein A3D06_01865 [Candidatus Roizmanbacteria bacterium RIFCSPHIGHO2_02_FULL_40_9]OGK45075.1 MAG: hypothetical protein A2957_02145 [Candidatus Roizmanbacteria bacterium RIFCSPLOWO2_01_FULL_38_11]